jgi:hypothetical protein
MATSTENHLDGPADESVIGPLVAALEAAWAAIRHRHPDVPPVVLTIASGTVGERPGRTRLGHFAGARWEHVEQGDLAELFVAGEGLAEGPLEVLDTLLHEAAHGIAHTRGIQDTSRQGRYHNTSYKKIAQEVGLVVTKTDPIGWSGTTVPEATTADYRAQLDQLTTAIRAHRRSEHIARTLGPSAAGGEDGQGQGDGGRASNNNGVAARCRCEPPRRIRVARSVLDAAPIICGGPETDGCGHRFEAPAED